MTSFHELVYGLGLLIIAVALHFIAIEIQSFFDTRHNEKVKRWGEEAIKKSRK